MLCKCLVILASFKLYKAEEMNQFWIWHPHGPTHKITLEDVWLYNLPYNHNRNHMCMFWHFKWLRRLWMTPTGYTCEFQCLYAHLQSDCSAHWQDDLCGGSDCQFVPLWPLRSLSAHQQEHTCDACQNSSVLTAVFICIQHNVHLPANNNNIKQLNNQTVTSTVVTR